MTPSFGDNPLTFTFTADAAALEKARRQQQVVFIQDGYVNKVVA